MPARISDDGVGALELTPADEAPVGEAQRPARRSRAGRPSRARCRRRRSGRAARVASRAAAAATVRAPRRSSSKRASAAASSPASNSSVRVNAAVADRRRPGDDVLHRAAAVGGVTVAADARRDVLVVARERLEPDLDVRRDLVPRAEHRRPPRRARAAAPSRARGGRPSRGPRRSSRRARPSRARCAARQTRATDRSGSVCAPISSKRSNAALGVVAVEHARRT